ncbi:hypothetical protein CEXT_476031 [Caerostris extrusa]|uniref:Uncharacterized protein n=1 Tax=Caerostris extrusa TaxID=172846 RepID=A0AAV4U1S9_CAEEX|nr:hypothetical protein CEXT_476031 [Caerostris extrusa]
MKSGLVNTVEGIRGYRTFIIGRRHWDGKKNVMVNPSEEPDHLFDIHRLRGMNNKCAQIWDYTINLEFPKQLCLENPLRLQRMNVTKYSVAKDAETFTPRNFEPSIVPKTRLVGSS